MRIGDDMELGMTNDELINPSHLPISSWALGCNETQNSKLNTQNYATGFTLIELIVVVAIIGILATIALPAMRNAPIKAREAVIRADLYEMRSCIDQHLADKGVYPESLQALVDKGYLRYIPIDPFSGTADGAWEELYANPEELEELAPLDEEYSTGNQVIDVRYADDTRVALDGTMISEW
jgi:general secretion pathway protein G